MFEIDKLDVGGVPVVHIANAWVPCIIFYVFQYRWPDGIKT